MCRAAESTQAQMKEVGQGDTVHSVDIDKKNRSRTGRPGRERTANNKGCGNCGRSHDPGNCVARGKTCNECGRLNHFAVVCRSKQRRESKYTKDVKAINEDTDSEDSGEMYVLYEVASVRLDDSQLVTLRHGIPVARCCVRGARLARPLPRWTPRTPLLYYFRV